VEEGGENNMELLSDGKASPAATCSCVNYLNISAQKFDKNKTGYIDYNEIMNIQREYS